jgi:tRNA(Arg) A34 adenosine deaminase TadA
MNPRLTFPKHREATERLFWIGASKGLDMDDIDNDVRFACERDAIVALGLLAYHYATFDPPMPVGSGKTTHVRGFNVRAFVVDNRDGEVVAVGHNQIYADENPLQHAEQTAVRAAITRLHAKYPRPSGMTVDAYYKTQLFMSPGVERSDFLRRGCTLYNTFDPCGMCAVTLLVCYMKRIAYLFEDRKFSAVYGHMKANYFSGRDSAKEPVTLEASDSSPLIGEASRQLTACRAAVHRLEQANVPLVHTLDTCFQELGEAATTLSRLTADALITTGDEQRCNARTLRDLQRLCNLG